MLKFKLVSLFLFLLTLSSFAQVSINGTAENTYHITNDFTAFRDTIDARAKAIVSDSLATATNYDSVRAIASDSLTVHDATLRNDIKDTTRAHLGDGATASPKFPLSITGYDGLTGLMDNVDAVHPSIAFNDSGWNGYRYWMALTFLPIQSENPHIYVSNNGADWREPPGITNPIYTYQQCINAGYSWNSDPNLLFLPNDNLRIYWRPQKTAGSAIYYMDSGDGVTWGTPTKILDATTTDDSLLISPCVLYVNGQYELWYTEPTGSNNYQLYHRTSADGITFGARDTCTVTHTNTKILTGYDALKYDQVWHQEVRYIDTDSTYYMLVNTPNSASSGRLFVYTSTDAINWTCSNRPIPRMGHNLDNTGSERPHYKASFIPLGGNPIRWDIWYGINSTGGIGWRIGFVENINLDEYINSVPDRNILQSELPIRISLPAMMFKSATGTPLQGDYAATPYWIMRDSTRCRIDAAITIRDYITNITPRIYWTNLSDSTGSCQLNITYFYRNQEGVTLGTGSGPTGITSSSLTDTTCNTSAKKYTLNISDMPVINVSVGGADKDTFLFSFMFERRGDLYATTDNLAGDIGIIAIEFIVNTHTYQGDL